MPLVVATPDNLQGVVCPNPATIEIALLNNLGDGGLKGGERQFIEILREASGPDCVRLRLFSLPGIARSPEAQARIAARYMPFATLMRSHVDGLIVTGAEPRTDSLPQEMFWHELTEVIDWAEHNTRSAIWSCLAAHAAVLHLDGIERRRLPRKCFGVFAVRRVAEHPLLTGLRAPFVVPHSRWNELVSDELSAAGYQTLTLSEIAGVDTFIKQWRSLFVFLQGHPEYDPGALGREFRRDIGRYVDCSTLSRPSAPENYFEAAIEKMLAPPIAKESDRSILDLLVDLPLSSHLFHRGRRLSRILFRNWLSYLSDPVGEALTKADGVQSSSSKEASS